MKALAQSYENRLRTQGFNRIVGIDEVGRGAWAGPIVAAGVIFDSEIKIPGVHDSKKLTEKNRRDLAEEIKAQASAHVIVEISNTVIDEQGIGWANAELVHRIINELTPDFALIDKVWIRDVAVPHELIIKGDAKVFSIAAASIIAKVHRDALMATMDEKFPGYNFAGNKGYGTKDHQNGLAKIGACAIHRQSYQPINQLKLI